MMDMRKEAVQGKVRSFQIEMKWPPICPSVMMRVRNRAGSFRNSDFCLDKNGKIGK